MQTQLQYQNMPSSDQNGDYVGQHNGKTYRCAAFSLFDICELTVCRLRVDQQPIRARMCGFGDKVRKLAQQSIVLAEVQN